MYPWETGLLIRNWNWNWQYIIQQQVENGVSFDYIGGDGYYGNDANLARAIDQKGYLFMLDIHSYQKIFILKPDLFLPERKSSKMTCDFFQQKT